MSSSPKGLYDEKFIRERCDWSEFEDWAAFVAEPQHSPEEVEKLSGVPAELIRQAARLYATRRQRRDLLRPRRHRAQPGLDHGDGDRQPRHGDRQYRPAGRRREPAARPEQRAGRLRHGLLPARAAGLPPHVGRRDARDLREPVGRHARRRARPAHPQHARRRRRRHLQGPLHPGRGHPAVRPQHQPMSRPASRRWNASSCTTSSSTRPPTTRMSSCRARPSWRRTAPSPTPSAASTWCAR